MVARKYVSLNIEYPLLPRAFLKILKMANMSSTELAMHLTKAAVTTILAQWKAEPWKRDIETKGTDRAFYNRLQPLAGPGKKEPRPKKNPDTRE